METRALPIHLLSILIILITTTRLPPVCLAAPAPAAAAGYLAQLAGRERLWVLVAPDPRDRSFQAMMSLMSRDAYCELSERQVRLLLVVVTPAPGGVAGGALNATLRRVSHTGRPLDEPLPASAPVRAALAAMRLDPRRFGMALLRKTLQVERRLVTPVRFQALLRAIDVMPARRRERLGRRGWAQRCRETADAPAARAAPAASAGAPPGAARSAHRVPPPPPARMNVPRVPPTLAPVAPPAPRVPPASRAPVAPAASRVPVAPAAPRVPPASRAPVAPPPSRAPMGAQRGCGRGEACGGGDGGAGVAGSARGGGGGGGAEAAGSGAAALSAFLQHFRGRRRLLVLGAPAEEDAAYRAQKFALKGRECELALRKVSVLALLGNASMSTLRIDHHHTGHAEQVALNVRNELISFEMLGALRHEFGLPHATYRLVLADYDMRATAHFENPVPLDTLLRVLDQLPSRLQELALETGARARCGSGRGAAGNALAHLLSRFHSKKRLFVISSPGKREHSYVQQLHALRGQACSLGLRHVVVIQLLGLDQDVHGQLEIYPANGKPHAVEREMIDSVMARNLRAHFGLREDYFSMVLVSKEGEVTSWFPSAMWSMAIVYDLIDSSPSRQHEMALQQSSGLRCPERVSAGKARF
ncbi:coiled-coil domain-containing protein 80-like [Lethenteron reissneri]|uniref:coiled-coil domain-containing protein 80-like n=1 Tax=Lethenteron reissneri TaxID=7753 RepID=UPI002AB6E825|nr:coiled-coil domain-containing protein 80-like [Lethenteron reissneri]